jgi:hypothetical protein
MTNDIIVDDDLIPLELQEDIKNFLSNSYFPWYLCEEKTLTSPRSTYNHFKTISENVFEYSQFVHMFVNDYTVVSFANHIPMIIANALKKKYNFLGNILRSKANLSTRVSTSPNSLYNTPHVDHLNSHWVVIYYVNDSDGSTTIFNENISLTQSMTAIDQLTIQQQITPKQGRCVVFDGNRVHAGMHPTGSDYRTVINFNFSKQ